MTDTAIIACPHCGGLNRAPVSRLEAREAPSCGKCHSPLFDGHPTELASAEAFDRLVLRRHLGASSPTDDPGGERPA